MTKKLSDVVITSALRTPIGTLEVVYGKNLNADKLGSILLKKLYKNSKLKGE